jgi:ketosteroid isomerase-like protein
MSGTVIAFILFAFSATVGLNQSTPDTLEWSAAEKEIWTLEARYMAFFKDGDLDGVASFYHQDFLGWPSHSIAPVNRSEGRVSVEHLLQTLEVTDLEFHPRAIHIEGEIALAHYNVVLTIIADGGAPEEMPFRLTHTWIKENGSWKILGGMSARVDIEQ